MSQRNLHKHLKAMGMIKYEQEDAITWIEWIALKSEKRYQLKKYYLRNNIKLPTNESE